MRNMSKIFRMRPNGTAQNGIGRRSTAPVLRKKLNCQSLLLRVVLLCGSPITGPQFQSALNASCSYLQVLGSPTVLGSY